jgi:hypothetical protein
MVSLVILLAACGDNIAGLDAESSQDVFGEANRRIHLTHVEMGELDEWPETYEAACDEGGTISVMTLDDGEPFGTLIHTYDRCIEDGWILDGGITYAGFERCENDRYTFTIEGRLEVEGFGACVVAAVETCGAISGEACGNPL